MKIITLEHPEITDLFVQSNGNIWFYSDRLSARGLKHKEMATQYEACHLLSQQDDKYGYSYVTLPASVAKWQGLGKLDSKGSFRPMKKKAHQLVAQTFCDNPNRYKYVDHIDEVKLNNSSNNLRWVSKAENNSKDFRSKGFHKIVDKYPEETKQLALDLMINRGYSVIDTSKITGVKTNTLSEAKREDTWQKAWRRFNDQSKDVDSSESKRGTSKDEDMVYS